MASTKSTSPEGGDSSSLSHQINASILSSHTTLNRLILDRMPLAVPPHTKNPSAYITGLLHIGAVYIAFESLWQNLIGIHSEIAPIPYTFPFNSPDEQEQHVETPKITARTRRVLEEAYSATMLRAPRIKADVQTMTGWPDHVFEQQLKLAGTSGRLGKFTLHIRDTVNAKPHVLLAYAHTLYLALLSGGSYIRTELMLIDREFWEATPTPIAPGMVECRPVQGTQQRRRQQRGGDDGKQDDDADAARPLPLEFLDFDPPLGANPRQQTKLLKVDLKARLAAADAFLADPERRDIVAEAGLIFHHLEGMVGQLDTLFAGPSATPAANNKTHTQRVMGGVGGRLRDSIAIAKGRLLRTRRKSSGSSVFTTTPVPVLTTTEEDEEEASRMDPLSTNPSSVSANSGVGHGAGEPGGEDLLARDAVVPHQGFRTIRYGSDLAKPDRKAAFANNTMDVNTPHSFNGASDQCCPMSRRPVMKSAVPDYALYAIVSNFVLLGGVMGFFAAWLWMRHGETVMTI